MTSDPKSLKRIVFKNPITIFTRPAVYIINNHLVVQVISSFNRLSFCPVQGTILSTYSEKFCFKLSMMVMIYVNCLVEYLVN